MFRTPEDFAAVGAFALEHGARIMQAVGEHVQGSVAPWHELAVVPDHPLEAVVRLLCHCASSSDADPACSGRCPLLLPRGPTPGMFRPAHESALAPRVQSGRRAAA